MSISRTDDEHSYTVGMEAYFPEASGTTSEKLLHWPKFVSRQSVATFLYKADLFQRILNVHGSIFEFGVWMGGGLFTWAHLSAVYEPFNYQRRVVGFDTFEGFPRVDPEDEAAGTSRLAHAGAFAVEGIEADLRRATELFDLNRPLSHIPKIELVRGDVNDSVARYLEQQPHTIISLLYLDLDLYQPTKRVVELLWDRVPRGGIIAFDELNSPEWPGETQAALETIGIDTLRLERAPYEPSRCYAVRN